MLTLKLIICKMIQNILKKIGRGTSLPGEIALKLDKNILKKLELPKTTICVTGTTGKTSISGTLTEIYKNAGLKVGSNSKGSNLKAGVTSVILDSVNIFGKTKVDVLVLETDERYVKEVFKDFKPNYFVINNLSRDQLARNGHFDIVFDDIKMRITKDIHLVLNADDPLVMKFSLGHKGKISYYGLAKTKYSTKKNTSKLDMMYCPVCHKKLEFDYFHYANLGNYHCPNNDFNRPDNLYEAKLNNDNTFTLDGNKIKMNNDALYNIYNLSASYVVAKNSGINTSSIVETLNNLSLKIKRLDTFKIGKKEGVILLSKNDTPISYNQSIDYVKKQTGDKTIFLGFNVISGRYNIKDLSWLYDVNFELLNDDSIKKIFCFGRFANDVALRLKYADIDTKKIEVIEDSSLILETFKKKSKGITYLIFPFDLEHVLREQLSEVEK